MYWKEWLNVFVCMYLPCRDHVHNVDLGGLFDNLWTLDIHTHTHTHTLWYGYMLFLFLGPNLWPQSYYFLFWFSQSFHYCWVFVVSAALAGDLRLQVSPNRGSSYSRRPFPLLSLHFERWWGGWGVATSWRCTFWVSVSDFWTPACVLGIPKPLTHHLQHRCFHWFFFLNHFPSIY